MVDGVVMLEIGTKSPLYECKTISVMKCKAFGVRFMVVGDLRYPRIQSTFAVSRIQTAGSMGCTLLESRKP